MSKPERLLRAGEAAKVLHVTSKTITRYATHHGLPCVETPGGHRRYRLSELIEWADQQGEHREQNKAAASERGRQAASKSSRGRRNGSTP